MNRYVSYLLMIVLMFGALPAAAEFKPTFTYLPTQTSQPGETLDDFALRTAHVLADFTKDKGWEVCAVIGQNAEGLYAYSPTSMGASMACPLLEGALPDGFLSTGVSIHSHPTGKRLIPSEADLLLAQYHKRYLDPKGVKNGGGGGFSPEDFKAGPGYLVIGEKVLHQAGLRTVRRVRGS